MTIADLLARAQALMPQGTVQASTVTGTAAGPCAGVTSDSRQVMPGSIFVALRGQNVDGARFIDEALSAGAAAIVSELSTSAPGMSWLEVTNARVALAYLAAEFYEHPSQQLKVIGITGTNGKTTTSYLVRAIVEASGTRCGLLGTVGHLIGDRPVASARTTPEATDVQRLLRDMVKEGCGACVMEVSSHALALSRVDAMRFSAAVFTNLTRDHLDFHADMESYFAAKRRLFEQLPQDAPAVVNADDPRGTSLVGFGAKTVTYAITKAADIMPGPLTFSVEGLTFDVTTPVGTVRVRSKLVGKVNVYNILAAIGTAVALGLPVSAIEQGLSSLAGVPGRFEVVSEPRDGVSVIVDYAHTDDALRNLLETARTLGGRRLITVFGAGGDRDRAKRPLMGMVAARLSDVVVITSDNPRSEDPMRIIEEVSLGAVPEKRRGVQVETISDRRDAIHAAIAWAGPGDIVLIAGKGHEKYQEIAGRTLPFDDAAVAREALAARRLKARVG